MRTKLVKRYYCDHCSKGALRKDSMARHEEICFSNPRRGCYLCNDVVRAPDEPYAGLRQVDMPSLRKALAEGGIQALADAAQNCPACIMSAILQQWKDGPQREEDYIEFDYKAALKDWRATENAFPFNP